MRIPLLLCVHHLRGGSRLNIAYYYAFRITLPEVHHIHLRSDVNYTDEMHHHCVWLNPPDEIS